MKGRRVVKLQSYQMSRKLSQKMQSHPSLILYIPISIYKAHNVGRAEYEEYCSCCLLLLLLKYKRASMRNDNERKRVLVFFVNDFLGRLNRET